VKSTRIPAQRAATAVMTASEEGFMRKF